MPSKLAQTILLLIVAIFAIAINRFYLQQSADGTKLMEWSVTVLFDPYEGDHNENNGSSSTLFTIGFQGPEVVYNEFCTLIDNMNAEEKRKYNTIESLAALLDSVYRLQNLPKPYTYLVTRAGKLYKITVGSGTGPLVERPKSNLIVMGDNGDEAVAEKMQLYLEEKLKAKTAPGEELPTFKDEAELKAIIREAYEHFGLTPPGSMQIQQGTATISAEESKNNDVDDD